MKGTNRNDLLRFEIEIKKNGRLAYTEVTANNIKQAIEKASKLYKTFTGTIHMIGLN